MVNLGDTATAVEATDIHNVSTSLFATSVIATFNGLRTQVSKGSRRD